jgi:hypothetical protein
MPLNEYEFLSQWRVEATCGEVADVLGDALGLVRWWPSVYLAVEQLAPPRADGTGRRVRLHTKGWLPYTLRWEFEIVESRYPHGFTLVASGDFEGRGVWTFVQDGPFVDIVYDWRISAEKPLLRNLSFVMKPLFEANHRWAMARGEESLALELQRRRATSDAARMAVPQPPGPVTYAGVAVLAGAAASVAGIAYLVRRATRSRSRSG